MCICRVCTCSECINLDEWICCHGKIKLHTYITGAYIALSNNMIKALYNEQIITIIIITYIYIALKTCF